MGGNLSGWSNIRGRGIIFFVVEGREVAEGLGGLFVEGGGERVGPEQGRDGMGAEVDGAQGGELGLQIKVAL